MALGGPTRCVSCVQLRRLLELAFVLYCVIQMGNIDTVALGWVKKKELAGWMIKGWVKIRNDK